MHAADPPNTAGGAWLMLTFPLQGAEGVSGLRGQLGQEGPGVSVDGAFWGLTFGRLSCGWL